MSVQNEDSKEKELELKSSAQSKFNLKGWLTSVLRRASFRWGPRSEALRLARVERGLYKCAICKDNFKNKEIIIDHIDPVVPLTGFQFRENDLPDWNGFIDRLFCPVEGFQILCKTCSDAKTDLEDKIRAANNKLRKEELKNARKAQKSLNKS